MSGKTSSPNLQNTKDCSVNVGATWGKFTANGMMKASVETINVINSSTQPNTENSYE